jgi:hypothetical protein
MLTLSGCQKQKAQDTPSEAHDAGDVSAAMRQVDGVSRVEHIGTLSGAKCRIIHIAAYRNCNRKLLEIDLRDQNPDVTEKKIEAEYQAKLAIMRKVQGNQLRLIRWLAKEYGIRAIYLEGLTDIDKDIYAETVRFVSTGERAMFIDAAGQALLAGDIESVLPAEDEAAFEAAIAVPDDGVKVDVAANDAREAAMVRRLADSGPLAVVILGAEHDLSKRAKDMGCDYIKVYVDGLPKE